MTYTAEDILAILPSLDPEQVNASTGRGQCVYTDPTDPDRHCIAGEIASRLGLTLPPVGDSHNSATVADVLTFLDNFDDEALDLLDTLQLEADNMYPWGVCINAVAGPAYVGRVPVAG